MSAPLGASASAPGKGGDGTADTRPPALLLVLFALVAGWHALFLPLFEGPDEPGNLLYLQFLAQEQRLPRPSLEPTAELEVLDRGIVPPLWFLGVAPVTWAIGAADWRVVAASNPHFLRRTAAPVEEALAEPTARLHHRHGQDERRLLGSAPARQLFLLRLLSIPFALVALWAIWRAALLVAPLAADDAVARRRFAWAAAALAATTPQFQHLSGTLTNDLCLAALGSLTLLHGTRWIAARNAGDASRAAGRAGFFAALACLVKLNGLVLLPALFLIALVARRRGLPWFGPLFKAALIVLAVAGPWYLWGFLETGHPLWAFAYQHVSPYHNPPGMAPEPHSVQRWLGFWLQLHLTWVGNFAWTAVWFPLPVTIAAAGVIAAGAGGALAVGRGWSGWRALLCVLVPAGVTLVAARMWIEPWSTAFQSGSAERLGSYAALAAVAGFALWGARRFAAGDSRAPAPAARAVLGGLAAAALLMLAAEVYFNLRFSQPQARHLYPFLPALVVPVALGLARLRLLRPALVLQGLLSVWGLAMLHGELRPAGWNQSPLFHATDALRQGEGSRPELAPRWISPEPNSVPDAAPVLVFEGQTGGSHELVLGIDNPELDPRPWRAGPKLIRSARDLGTDLVGGRVEVPVPEGLWSSLSPGTRVDVCVLALDERGALLAAGPVLTIWRGSP